jgi:hypothetical protein
MSPQPLEAICHLSETYGRALFRDPQKVEAMLRDLCPEHKREIFLLVSSLKEQIVPDLMSAQVGTVGGVPEEVIVARTRRKLADNLGFTEECAVWAVDSWLQASRILATAPDVPLPVFATPTFDESVVSETAQAGLDWIWLALCLASVIVSSLTIVHVAWFALHHDTSTFRSWATDASWLAAGLLVSDLTLWAVARQFQNRRLPNHWIANPNLGAAAMVCEVAAILALPLVPVAAIALWGGEWAQWWHGSPPHPHDLTFHLGRILQSLLLAVFLWYWTAQTVRIQGRLGSSAIGRRG